MKKLLIATDCFLPRWDGIARSLLELLPRLSKSFDITVIAPAFRGEFKKSLFKNIKIIRFPLLWFRVDDYTPARHNQETIKKEIKKADVIWVQSLGPIGVSTINHAYLLKRPVVAQVNSFEWDLATVAFPIPFFLDGIFARILRELAKRFYSKCSLLVVPSKEIGLALDRQGFKTTKTIAHLGVSTKEFVPIKDKAKAKFKIGIDPSFTVISYCGRIGKEKNIVTLLNAFKRLEKRHKNIWLLIAGGKVREKQLANSINNITLIKQVDNIVDYLQATDIYVMPSLTETTSLSTMEAMSCGLAVVSTRVGYIKNYLKENENGLFFRKESSRDLARKIELLIKNKRLRKRLGINARKTMMGYSWDKSAKKIKEILNKI